MHYRKVIVIVIVIVQSMMCFAQKWIPVEEFPLLFQRMEKATIHYGFSEEKTKLLPCNIHVSTERRGQLLYYINEKGEVMETEPANVRCVEFPDGKYIPVMLTCFGRVEHEDSVGKVVRVWDTDRDKLLRDKHTTIGTATRANLEMMRWYVPSKSDVQIPMKVSYYFFFRGNIFEITEKNILNNIKQSRRHEYRAFTRSEEIISTNLSSVMKIWERFFVNFEG